jgi:MerR family transcriptional regulator/heat shock protein HspR|tara:strand:- start:42 stop:311 length:270 start_codon:yes stop_codon:yes gene_type:complete
MVGLHAQTLRYYERAGLLEPSRSIGRQRLYSRRDIERVRRIRELTEDMGLNLTGVEVALKLINQVNRMQKDIEDLKTENDRLKTLLGIR